ncbi:MAG: extracellular solute-binding protein [Cryobacterium sp.]|nr:extracellular solute-binding protein [Cryobacterium sp.]
MERRDFLRVAALSGLGVLGATTLASCAPEDQGSTGPSTDSPTTPISADISFALFPGYLAMVKKDVFDPFTSDNPGVTVEGIEGPASQTYAQLLASPAGARSIHGGMMNDALSWSGVKDELWQKMSTSEIPNIDTIPESLRNDAGTPWVFNGFGITYNPEKLPNGIDSWKDLYSPSLKGKVGMWPAYLDAYLMASVAEGVKETDIEKGIEAWKKAKDNIGMWITAVADLHQAMDRGEIWVAPDFLSTAVRDAKAGMKLAFSIPKEGAVLNTYQLEVVDGISEDETRAMEGLIDLCLGDQTQSDAFNAQYLTPANSTVKVDASNAKIQGLENYNFTASDAEKSFYKPDYKWVGENKDKITKLIEDNLK